MAAIRLVGSGETPDQAHPGIVAQAAGLTSAAPASARSHSGSRSSNSVVEIPPPEDPSVYKRRRVASRADSRQEGPSGERHRGQSVLRDAPNELHQEDAPRSGGGEREESPVVIDHTHYPVCPQSGTRGAPLKWLKGNWKKLFSALKKPEEARAQRKLQTALAARDVAAEKLASANAELARASAEMARANAELARAQKFIDDSDKEIRKYRLRHIRGMERVISLRLKNNKGRRQKKGKPKSKGKGKGKGKEREIQPFVNSAGGARGSEVGAESDCDFMDTV
jgi:hypothetical protein